MVHAFDGAFEAADRAVQVGRVVGHGHVGLLEHAVGQRMVDHDAVGGGDEHVARLAEAHVGQFAQDVAVLQVDGARDHEQHPAGRIEHRLGDGDLRQAVEPVAVRLGDHARARGDRVLEVRAVLHVHLADLSRAVQVGDQLAVRVQEGDVVERRPQGLVLFQKGLQRRGVRDAVRAHALGDRLQQDAPARELLLHRARDGRQPRELLVGDRGLHAVLDQVQRHRGDDEGGGQHDGRNADAEARVQADAAFRGREEFHGRRAGGAAKRRGPPAGPARGARHTPFARCAASVSESARNARHCGASRGVPGGRSVAQVREGNQSYYSTRGGGSDRAAAGERAGAMSTIAPSCPRRTRRRVPSSRRSSAASAAIFPLMPRVERSLTSSIL
ncbi:hypothetical protein FQZ97_673120 [compost metagenome]